MESKSVFFVAHVGFAVTLWYSTIYSMANMRALLYVSLGFFSPGIFYKLNS